MGDFHPSTSLILGPSQPTIPNGNPDRISRFFRNPTDRKPTDRQTNRLMVIQVTKPVPTPAYALLIV